MFVGGRERAQIRVTSRSRGVAGRVGKLAAQALHEDVPRLREFVELLQELAGPGYTAELVQSGGGMDVEQAGALVGDLLRSVGIAPPPERP